LAAVDAIRAKLATVPAKDDSAREVTRQEAIARMADEIRSLRERGYSWSEVASIVSREGCQVTPGALKTGLSRKGLTPKTRKRRTSAAPATAEAAMSAAPDGSNAKAPEVPAVGKQTAPPVAAPEGGTGTFAAREDTVDI
jgi:hypothetical protein